MALARATSACPGPVLLIGKKMSGSTERHAANSHQLLVALVATLTSCCAEVSTSTQARSFTPKVADKVTTARAGQPSLARALRFAAALRVVRRS
jgi:hypothetical protein